jgi:hypothetical protein
MDFRRPSARDTSIATGMPSVAAPTITSGFSGASFSASALPTCSPKRTPRSMTIIREMAKFGLIGTIGRSTLRPATSTVQTCPLPESFVLSSVIVLRPWY